MIIYKLYIFVCSTIFQNNEIRFIKFGESVRIVSTLERSYSDNNISTVKICLFFVIMSPHSFVAPFIRLEDSSMVSATANSNISTNVSQSVTPIKVCS
eukprot:UN33357